MIPVSFEYEGIQYSGYLQSVSGAAASVWHLMIDHYYRGQLVHEESGFAFHSQTGAFESLSDYFGDVVMAWYG